MKESLTDKPSGSGMSYKLPDGSWINADSPEELQNAQQQFWKAWSVAMRVHSLLKKNEPQAQTKTKGKRS